MKNVYKLLFALILSFLFITNIDAAAKFDFKLSCPANAVTNQNIECTVSALVTGEEIKKLDIDITRNNLISYISNNLDTNIGITSDYVNIGKITFKSKTTSGKASVTVSIKPTTVNNTTLQTKTKNAYITIKSNVNTLKSLRVDGQTVSNFDKNKVSYTMNTTKSKVTITGEPTSSKATITGTGTKDLKCGSNVFTIKVTSENGIKKNYTLGITRNCDKNVYLDNIEVSSGTLKPTFNKNTMNYTVDVNKDVEKITVTGIKSSNNQTVTGNVIDKRLEYGENKVTITVTSQTGEKQTYTVNIIRKDNRDTNVYLSSLSLSSGDINFDKNNLLYETTVLYDIENIEILATPEKETSKVTITGNKNLKVGENTINVKVISENNDEKTYVIKVTRLKEGETFGDNANIKDLTIKGYDIKFDVNKTEYKLVIDKEEKLDINVVMEDESATYEIIGNENLKDGSIIEIVTKSNDGTSKTYKINIIKNSYTIYYIIAGVILLLAIAIPIFIYFKVVKEKKKNLDVNGYEVGKGYEDIDYSRKVIQSNNEIVNQQYIDPNNQNYINQSNQSSYISQDNITNSNNYNFQNDLSNQNINNFNEIPQNYEQNQFGTTCPNCGRELLGNPNECPYCKIVLR